MLFIINYILGYVKIQISGTYTQRFLNLLAKKNIPFWDIEYIELGEITLCLRVSDFKRLSPIVRKTMCHVHILEKVGLPFFLHRFKKRVALLAGVFVFCIVIWVLTSFVWVIDIVGGDASLYPEIRKQLAYSGLDIGTYSQSINYADLKNDMLLNFPSLSNLTVNISGSHAVVELHMRTPPPEIIDYSLPSNIIADYDGIITSITVTSGMPEVAAGDVVTKGQLLAGGYMTGRTGTTVSSRAIAEIRARTWEHMRITMPQKTSKKNYTGNIKKLYTLILGKKRIKLYFGTGNSYDTCDKIIEKVTLALPMGLKVPIKLETCTLKEYTLSEYTLSQNEAEHYLIENAKKYINLKDGDTLLNLNTEYKTENGVITLYCVAECERKIGTEQMIPKGE